MLLLSPYSGRFWFSRCSFGPKGQVPGQALPSTHPPVEVGQSPENRDPGRLCYRDVCQIYRALPQNHWIPESLGKSEAAIFTLGLSSSSEGLGLANQATWQGPSRRRAGSCFPFLSPSFPGSSHPLAALTSDSTGFSLSCSFPPAAAICAGI